MEVTVIAQANNSHRTTFLDLQVLKTPASLKRHQFNTDMGYQKPQFSTTFSLLLCPK